MDNPELRTQIVSLLRGEHAHMSFADMVKDFPAVHYNTRPPNVSYSFWHLLEHLRITQWDVLDFMKNPDYTYIKWPDSYWPKRSAKATKKEWDTTIKGFLKDLNELENLARDPNLDLYAKIPWGEGQTNYREFIVVGNHNSYHMGEFAILRQVMNCWQPDHA